MAKPAVIFGDMAAEARRGPAWQATAGTLIAGESEVTETDTLAASLERRWGAGRLRLLVGAELREKFDRQRYLFNQAIWHGDLEAVRRESRRMRSAWAALDKAATAQGASPIDPDVWETTLPDGTVAAIVRTNADAAHVLAEGRRVRVYTLAEIARLLHGFPALATAKETFPGAAVVAVREVSDALDGIADTRAGLDDEIPF